LQELAVSRRQQNLRKLSTKELLARWDEARKKCVESFACEGAEQQVIREGVGIQGRLIPDSAGEKKLRRLEGEINRRLKLHDPQLLKYALKRLKGKGGKHRQSSTEAIEATIGNAKKAVAKLDATARVVGLAPGQPRDSARLAVELTDREKTIWTVIRQGLKGMRYCRELDDAGIKSRKSGSWKGCPGTYPAAYQAGAPWRHRIQDEKTKIRRKANPARLAGE
jgi:hypothetical protein